jgi:hypothetical protein
VEDDQIVMRAALLFQTLIQDFSDYRDCEEGPEKDQRRDLLVYRMAALQKRELSITMMFMFDIMHTIGPDKIAELLEAASAKGEKTAA